jgi:uncharacterized membrane protein YuzA (DUF378 family)
MKIIQQQIFWGFSMLFCFIGSYNTTNSILEIITGMNGLICLINFCFISAKKIPKE